MTTTYELYGTPGPPTIANTQTGSLNETDYRSPDEPSCYRPAAPEHQPQDR